MNKIDKDLYSRQIFTYGMDTMSKIINLKILIIGLRGLGIEIAKNLILAGPKEVCISDKNLCKINDLGSNFYLTEKDVDKKTREDSCFDKLKSLNPYVKVSKFKGIYSEKIKNFDIIIITEMMKLEELYELDDICRKNNVYFIYTLNLGLTGYLFNDFGKNHSVYDLNGEKKLLYDIFKIEDKEDKYEIFPVMKNDEQFELREGDYIILNKIKGLEFLNTLKPRKIIKVNNLSFEIEKEKGKEGKYISDGMIEETTIPKLFQFDAFKDNFMKLNKNFINIDANKKKSNILLHCAFVGLHIYYSIYNIIPELNDLKIAQEIVKLSKSYFLVLREKYLDYLKLKKNKLVEFDEDYILNVFRWCKAEINPICTFLGGIVSQEALKITGKYTPIYQWMRFDFFETVENLSNSINREILNCRYDDQIAIFGQELQEKLNNLNIFMVGAGALGCEYIKNFALMGISCKNGKLTITDNDNISLSNLNRQFLFTKNDIKENSSKSFCARREALKINKDMNIKDYQLLINDDNRDIFNDEFIEKQDILISAVDNLSARKYIDNLSTFFDKIYINSGTEGTKANSGFYYPNQSICMNDLTFEEKKEIPMCTLKLFPTKIEHCIEFSKIVFKELFEQYISDIKLIFDDEEKFNDILSENQDRVQLYFILEIYKNILYIIENPSQSSIIKFGLFIFNYYFKYNINHILKENEASYSKIASNKRPKELDINLRDNDTILFFKSLFYILSEIVNFNEVLDLEKIEAMALNEKIYISEDLPESQKQIEKFNKDIIDLKNKIRIKEKVNSLKQISFDKDNDDNYHINFILSFSNLRAKNYNIETTDFLNVKEIAGNIIPAIASTTAAITGIASLQIYTLLQTDNLNSFRNCNINLGVGLISLYIPEDKRYIKDSFDNENNLVKKAIPRDFTIWDKIDILGPNITLKNIIDDFKEKYNADIDFINYKDDTLASPIDGDEDYFKTIEELIKENNITLPEKIKYIKLEISGNINNIEISTPTIRYTILKDDKISE